MEGIIKAVKLTPIKENTNPNTITVNLEVVYDYKALYKKLVGEEGNDPGDWTMNYMDDRGRLQQAPLSIIDEIEAAGVQSLYIEETITIASGGVA